MFCSKTWVIQLTSPNVRPPVAKKFMNTLYIIVYCICYFSESWYLELLAKKPKPKTKKNSLKHVNERKAWSWELSPLWMKGHNWRSGPAGTERRSLWLEILLYPPQTLKVRNKFAETVTACPQQFGHRGFHLRINFQGNLKHLSALSGGPAKSWKPCSALSYWRELEQNRLEATGVQ